MKNNQQKNMAKSNRKEENEKFLHSLKNSVGVFSLSETVNFLRFIGFDIDEIGLTGWMAVIGDLVLSQEGVSSCASKGCNTTCLQDIDALGKLILTTEIYFDGQNVFDLVHKLVDCDYPMIEMLA